MENKAMNILHLEDSFEFCENFRKTIEDLNVSLKQVSSFKELQRTLVRNGNEYDLVVSDVHVPMFSGRMPSDFGFEIKTEVLNLVDKSISMMFLTSDLDSSSVTEYAEDTPCFDKKDVELWKEKIQSFL